MWQNVFFLSFSCSLIVNLKVSGLNTDWRKEKFLVMITVLFKVKYCYRWEQKDLLLQDSDLTMHIWSTPSTPRLAVETACLGCHQSENVLAQRNYKCTTWSDVRKSTICRFVSQLSFISSDSPKAS